MPSCKGKMLCLDLRISISIFWHYSVNRKLKFLRRSSLFQFNMSKVPDETRYGEYCYRHAHHIGAPIMFITCSKCNKQTPIGKFCIECGEKSARVYIDYRVKSRAEVQMIRICSSCNVDSKYIKHGGDQRDYWSECTNCGTHNPKTVEIRQSDYDKVTVRTDCAGTRTGS